MSSVGGQNAKHMSSAGGEAAQQLGKRRRVREGLAVVGLLAGLVGGASLSVYLVARQLDEQWDDVGVAKRAEGCALVLLLLVVTGVLLWHLCSSQEAGDRVGEVLPGAQHVSSALASGRIFFFRRLFFKLRPPELDGKPYRLEYFASQFAEQAAGMISLMPRKFQVDDVKQPRPGRPYTFRLDGEDVDSGKAFKYVFACRTREEHGSWCKALRALSKADPAELEAGGVAQVILDGLEHDGWMELEATASQKAKNKVEQAKDRSGRALAQQAATIGALEDEASTLWVGSIPESHVSEDAIGDMLSQFGDILSITLRVKPAEECAGDAKRSWAFVTFADPESVTNAVFSGATVFGRSSLSESSASNGHPLRLRRANVAVELKKKRPGSPQHGALTGVADEHRLGKVGLHSYTESMMDAVQVLPRRWMLTWALGTVVIVVAGCTVLVAIPGSFLIPLMIWTPAVSAAETFPSEKSKRKELLHR